MLHITILQAEGLKFEAHGCAALHRDVKPTLGDLP